MRRRTSARASRGGRLAGWLLLPGLAVFLSAFSLPAAQVTLAAFGHRIVAPGASAGTSNGDTWDGAWGADGTLYFQHNDGTGFSNGVYVHDRICRLQGTPQMPATLSGADLNPGILGSSLAGSPCYSTGLYELDGVLYHNVCYSQQIPGAWVFHHTSMIKSGDGGRTWTNHLGQVNVMPPDDVNLCMFPSDYWGEVNFVKYGPGGSAPPVDNAGQYVYLSAGWGDCRLARVLRTDLPKLDKTKIQYYVGGNGMLDSSWTNNINQSVPVPTPSSSPTAVIYDPALGRYLMTSFSSDSWQTPPIESTLRLMEAAHPWGPWTQVLDENVNNVEGDNLTWAFLLPKFTSRDGKKIWMSVSGRAPYGLQLMPIYLATERVQSQEAETATVSGGFVTNWVAGYSGTGYVSGLDAPGKYCEFDFALSQGGVYIIQFRYDTSAYRNLGLFINGQQRRVLKLGKSEQVYATWTEMSALVLLGGGTNRIRLQCVDTSGNVNLDWLSLALYSTNALSGLEAHVAGSPAALTVLFDTIPGITYGLDWASNLAAIWQPVSSFTSTGSTAQVTYSSSSSTGFLRISASP